MGQPFVIILVRADLEPDNTVIIQNAQGPIIPGYANRINRGIVKDFLEIQSRIIGIFQESTVGSPGPSLNRIRKFGKLVAEISGDVRFHSWSGSSGSVCPS